MDFKVFAVGDVVGTSGIAYLKKSLRGFKKEHQIDFCVVNGENAAGIGMSPQQAEEILNAGADVITMGNHTWGRRELTNYIDRAPQVLRPANLPQQPGRGWSVFETYFGDVAVIDLIGRVSMDHTPDNPFLTVESILKEIDTSLILVEFHAEATSEKIAMGYMLDGRVSAVWGTHTHVQTADNRVFPKGTGFLTDLGMTGPLNSVLGVRPEQSVQNFLGCLTSRYEAAPGPCQLNGCIFTIDADSGLCTATERVMLYE